MSSDRTQKLFDSMLILHLKSLPKPEKLKDVGLVFFPIVDKSKYYTICFDLRVPTYYMIDHVNRNGVVEDIYGIKHVRVGIGIAVLQEKKQSDVVALNNIRIKYMVRLMKSEYNKHKSMLEKDVEEYERLDTLQKLDVMNEVKEIREK
ncbi:unnamed protein product [Lactuca saligna]|uniref:Uncharacterized protein n=1 Tax=Lactuca saligna TaxID=75948 RepID=A0AA36EJN5_LACSI|nr:unnamed protein product [Lactuca saligna]